MNLNQFRTRRSPGKEDDLSPEEDSGEEFSLDDRDTDADFSSGLFINSLDDLAEDDIPLSESAGKRERVSAGELFRRLLFWLFLASFLVSMFLLIRNFVQKQQATRIYSQLQEEFFSTGFSFDVSDAFRTDREETPGLEEDSEQHTIRTMTELLDGAENDFGLPEEEPGASASRGTYNKDLEMMRASLASLRRRNPDIYAWIVVPNTNISYPVTQSTDNDYDLNHAANGDYNPVGSVFVDYRCDASITRNFNTVFYGHNIATGSNSMFHDVTKFFKEEYFNDVDIYVYTPDCLFVYEPIAIYETSYDTDYFNVRFASADEFIEFADYCQELSALTKNFTFTGRDRVLTLSTCTNGYYTQRYALHAKLVKTILD